MVSKQSSNILNEESDEKSNIIICGSIIVVVIIIIIILICCMCKKKRCNEGYNKDKKITTVILNYGRPENVEKQVEKLGNNKYITEIIIGHGKANTYREYSHKNAKVRNIKDYKNNAKYYCLRRHILAIKAKNNLILMLDDDYIPSNEYIDHLYEEYEKDNKNFYGYYSRLCTRNGYKTAYPEKGRTVSTRPNVILPGVSFMNKKIIKKVWEKIKKSKYLQRILDNKANGEDLLFNYHFKQIYGKEPVLVKGKVEHLDNSNGYSAGAYTESGQKNEHYDFRGELCEEFDMDGQVKIVESKDRTMEKYGHNGRNLIIRILGNDLDGLHGDNQTYDNLEFTLKHEDNFKDCDKIFILNRITNDKKKEKYISLLNRFNIKYIEIPFDKKEFKNIKIPLIDKDELNRLENNPSYRSKKIMNQLYEHNLYLINNNGSRNYGIKYGKDHNYEWTFVFDSNAFLTKNQYNEIVNNIMEDSKYIVIPQLRLGEKNLQNQDILISNQNTKNLLKELSEKEPQIAFHYSSTDMFNDKLPYGASPKAEFLRRLNVPGNWLQWNDGQMFYGIKDRSEITDSWQKLGSVIRLNPGTTNNNTKTNYNNRTLGLYKLILSLK